MPLRQACSPLPAPAYCRKHKKFSLSLLQRRTLLKMLRSRDPVHPAAISVRESVRVNAIRMPGFPPIPPSPPTMSAALLLAGQGERLTSLTSQVPSRAQLEAPDGYIAPELQQSPSIALVSPLITLSPLKYKGAAEQNESGAVGPAQRGSVSRLLLLSAISSQLLQAAAQVALTKTRPANGSRRQGPSGAGAPDLLGTFPYWYSA